jgi:hypothetical protein
MRGAIRKLMAMHGIEEVREELQRFEQSPAKYAVAQRDRSVGVLLRELTEALRQRDYDRANGLAERVQRLAPLDERAQKLAGVGPESGVMRRQPGAEERHRVFWTGAAVGLAVGVLGATLLFLAVGG